MTLPDLNNLRVLLDEEERFAKSLAPGGPQAAIAAEMLAVIVEARAALHPSADSTANYLDSKRIIERLADLRRRAAGS